jgi:hypothetical protein
MNVSPTKIYKTRAGHFWNKRLEVVPKLVDQKQFSACHDVQVYLTF